MLERFRSLAKQLPMLHSVYRRLRRQLARLRLRSATGEAVFQDIYQRRVWGGRESFSGPGSDGDQTRVIVQQLPSVFREFQIASVLDIPCGDFNWMKNLDFGAITYTGADIVDEIVRGNSSQYGGRSVQFLRMNMLKDRLPRADLVLCRDCLVHFPITVVFIALENICDSNSKYILTTTFPARGENHDIEMGGWRPINLECAPFWLPRPLRVIREDCTEGEGAYQDKSLALWTVDSVRKALKQGRKS